MTARIRAMRPDDLPAILHIASEAWGRLTSQTAQPDFCEMFSSSAWRPHYYVAVVEGQVVGMIGWKTSWLCYGIYDLFWLAVRKNRRHQGIGRKLVDRCLVDLAEIADVIMLVTNVPEFYSKNWKFRLIANLKTSENYGENLMILEDQI
jgi:predicted N-acetyltransferase YhbS